MELHEVFHNYNCVNGIYAHIRLTDLIEFSSLTPTSAEVVDDHIHRRFEKFTLNKAFMNECHNSMDKILLAFEHIGPSLQDLTIEKLHTNNIVTANCIYDILIRCPVLKQLYIIHQDLRSNLFLKIAPGFPRRLVPLPLLQSFALKNCRVHDNGLKSFLGGCSNELQLISLYNTRVAGRCLDEAPNSVHILKLVGSIANRLDVYAVDYLRRNQNITSLVLSELFCFDLKRICCEIRNLESLVLLSTEFFNFKELAKLKKLQDLHIQIRNSAIKEYFLTLKPGNSLTGLTVALFIPKVSPELAASFAKLTSLEKLTVYMAGPVRNASLILSQLSAMPQLKHLELSEGEFDLEQLCTHATQLRRLSLNVNVDFINLDSFSNMLNLKQLDMTIHEPIYECDDDVINDAINRALVAIASAENLTTLIFSSVYNITLDESTVTAFQTSNLKRLVIGGVLEPAQAIRLLRNLANLETFGHTGPKYTKQMRDEIRAIRPENPIDIRVDM